MKNFLPEKLLCYICARMLKRFRCVLMALFFFVLTGLNKLRVKREKLALLT